MIPVTYIWATESDTGHSVTLSACNLGIILPRIQNPYAYTLAVSGANLSLEAVDVVSGTAMGFVGTAEDVSGGVWLLGYYGDITYVKNATTQEAYNSASGQIFTGATYCDGLPYFAAVSGNIYTVSGGVVTSVSGGFGEIISGLTTDGVNLYTVEPNAGNLGTYKFSTDTTGSASFASAQLEYPLFAYGVVSGTPGHYVSGTVVVGGWNPSMLVSGATSCQMNQAADTMVMANPVTNWIFLASGAEPDWAISAAVSGTGAPVMAAWISQGEQIAVADTTNNKIEIFDLEAGELVLSQVLDVSGVAQIAVTPDGNTIIAAAPSKNLLTILTNNLNVWSVAQSVSGITAPTSIITLSTTEAVVGASGVVDWLQSIDGTWSVSGSTSGIGFTPVGLANDNSGNVYAVGGTGTAHLAAVTPGDIVASTTWSGSASGVYWEQAQIAVLDATNECVRVFALAGATLAQQVLTDLPGVCTAFGFTNPSVWLCGVSGMWQYLFTAPFTLARQRAGAMAILRNGSWTVVQLEVGHQPSCATVDANYNIWLGTLQNDLDNYTIEGSLISSYELQPDGELANGMYPSLGMSDLLWWNGGLYASSSQNQALILVSGSALPVVTPVAPSAPTGLLVTGTTSTSVSLSWNPPTVGTAPLLYQIQYQVSGSVIWNSFGSYIAATSETVTGLTSNTSYSFRVTVNNIAGVATSSPITASTLALPSAPTNLAASNITTSGMTISWTASSSSSPVTYDLQYMVSGGVTWIDEPVTTATSGAVSGLASGTAYEFQVVATNQAGSATSATLLASTTSAGQAPSAPTGFTASNITNTSVAVSWNASTGTSPITYQPQYSLHGANSWLNAPSTTSLNEVINGLSVGVAYDLRIVATNSIGSATSNIMTVTTSTATEFDPNNTSATVTLSNSDLTATMNTSSAGGSRSTTSRATGLLYIEFTTTKFAANTRLGLATGSWTETNILGGDNDGIGISPAGVVYTDNTSTSGTSIAWVSGGILGIAINPISESLWLRVNGSPWYPASATNSVSGTQNSGATQPVVTGPASAIITLGATFSSFGASVTDTNWPLAGNGALNAWCTYGVVSVTPTGTGTVTGNDTNSLSYVDTPPNLQSTIGTVAYTAPATGTSDSVTIQVWDQYGNNNSITIPITLGATASNPVSGIGGYSFANIGAGPYFAAFFGEVSGSSATADYGASAFVYTAPSGFTSWDGSSPGVSGDIAPSAPGAPTISNITTQGVTLNWTASVSGTAPITYQPQYQVSGSSFWTLYESALSGTSGVITGLYADTVYSFSIQALNPYGSSTSTSTIATTANSNPDVGQAVGQITSGGQFSVSGGVIYTPNGSHFVAKGIAVLYSTIVSGTAAQMLSVYPDMNMCRLSVDVYPLPNPLSSTVLTFVSTLTSTGIVVTFDDHVAPSGGINIPGQPGTSYPGGTLADETDWYAYVAGLYVGNPYVWIETMNEPSDTSNEAEVTDQEVAIYNAVRGAGNTAPMMIELIGGADASGLTVASYTTMTNVIWDIHIYGWYNDYSTSITSLDAAIGTHIAELTGFTSAQGVMPVIIGEFGNSTTGSSVDANWTEVVQAVETSVSGSVAWAWTDPGENSYNALVDSGTTTLTAFGSAVAPYINTGTPATYQASNPTIVGPAQSKVMVSQGLPMPITLSDTNWPHAGNCAFNCSCVSGTISTTVSGVVVPGSGTNTIDYDATTASVQAAGTNLVYTAPASAGEDVLTLTVYDQVDNNSTLQMPITIVATSSGAPSATTVTVGTVTSNSVALSWTTPTYGTAPLVYTVFYQVVGATSWLPFDATASTSKTVTGLTSGTSYNFMVETSNSIGLSFSASVPATTGTTSGLPGDPTGTVPKRIADLLESFGVNCYPNGQDGAGAGYNSRTDTIASYVTGLTYLTGGTGMGLTNRVYGDGSSSANETAQVSFCTGVSAQMPNVKWCACWQWTNASMDTITQGLVSAGVCKFAEGPNEPNNSSQTNLTAAECVSAEQNLYTDFSASVPIAAASVIDTGSNTYEADYYGSLLTEAIQASTYWNGHDYPNSGAPSNDLWRRTGLIAGEGFPVSGVITEYHSLLYNTSTAQAGGDTLSGYYLVCGLLAAFLYFNTVAFIWYDMYDYGYNLSPPDYAYPVGLFEDYSPTTPRYPAQVMHNFFALCADASATRHTFAPSELNYTVTGLPAKWAGDGGIASGGGQQALFQGSNGTFYLLIWNEQNALATGTTETVTVTFNNVKMASVVDYSLTNGITVPATPIASYTNVGSLTMNLTTEVRLLVITYP